MDGGGGRRHLGRQADQVRHLVVVVIMIMIMIIMLLINVALVIAIEADQVRHLVVVVIMIIHDVADVCGGFANRG